MAPEVARKETTMERFFVVMLTLVGIIFPAFANEASAQPRCLLYHGSGGEKTFPKWLEARTIALEVSRPATLWLNHNCRKPKVILVTKGSGLKVRVERETFSDPHNVAEGWRIYFQSDSQSDNGKVVKVKILSTKTWYIRVVIRANALNVARGAAREAADARNMADEAKTTADEAKTTADEARTTADEAYVNSEGKRDVELVLSPMISLESPGHEGYGMSLGVNAILGKFASKGMLQLGLSGRLSWHYYEQEVIGLAQNSDVMAHEFDALAMFLFRLRPVWWFAAEATTGFGVRIFTHDDAVTIQGEDLLIRGVEGRVAYHPIWAANLGVKFYPHKVVSLGLSWGTTVSMTRQVQNPNAEGGSPSKANVWNHFLMFNLGFNF